MKSTTAQARVMSDDELRRTCDQLRRTLPRLHSLLDAVKRELDRRARNRKKAEKATVGVA